jgi:hypothetical protein
MPPPPNNIVNTPQSMPANLPQQHIPGRQPHAGSPSFSPQQPRGNEGATAEGMMTSPMVGQQMNVQGNQILQMQRMQQNSNVILQMAMNQLGLAGRDHLTLSGEEKVNSFFINLLVCVFLMAL